jgi:protein SCO1/2
MQIKKRQVFVKNSALPLFIAFIGTILIITPLFAHQGHEHTQPAQDSTSKVKKSIETGDSALNSPVNQIKLSATKPQEDSLMGIEEKPGAMIPLNVPFVDQHGDSVTFGACVKGPTIFTMLYYNCPNTCGLLLSGIAQVLRSYSDKPAEAPNVITLSVGDNEGPAESRKAETIVNETLQKNYPANKWHFLTGSAENIKTVADVAGFHYVKRGDDYDHPLLIMILSPTGKITRYITGTDFLPADITISLMEASHGTVQPTIARILRSCFSYDPKSHRLVFKTLQVSATVILSMLFVFVVFLIVAGKKRSGKGMSDVKRRT